MEVEGEGGEWMLTIHSSPRPRASTLMSSVGRDVIGTPEDKVGHNGGAGSIADGEHVRRREREGGALGLALHRPAAGWPSTAWPSTLWGLNKGGMRHENV